MDSSRPCLGPMLESADLEHVSLGLDLLQKYEARSIPEYAPRIIELTLFPNDYIQKQALECFAFILDEARASLFLERWLSLWKRSSGFLPDSEFLDLSLKAVSLASSLFHKKGSIQVRFGRLSIALGNLFDF